MMRKLVILILVVFLANAGLKAHPIKMTTGKVTYQEDSGSFKIILNFFIDDFGDHLVEQYNMPQIDFSKRDQNLNSVIQDYIAKNFNFSVNYKVRTYEVTDWEIIEENVAQVRLQTESITDCPITIEITNRLLLDAFSNQSNILNIQKNESMEFDVYRFSRGNIYKVFKVDFDCVKIPG